MASTLHNLQQLLADGKTGQVIQQLLTLSANAPDHHREVLQLSSQFEELERKSRLNLADSRTLDTERNRINDALLAVMDRLYKSRTPLKQRRRVGKIALWLGIFAAVATITGYTLKDFFRNPEPVKVEKSVEPPVQGEKTTVAPVVPPKEKPAVIDNRGKNNPNITVKDNGKVGTIITGDSNKIEVKQDF